LSYETHAAENSLLRSVVLYETSLRVKYEFQQAEQCVLSVLSDGLRHKGVPGYHLPPNREMLPLPPLCPLTYQQPAWEVPLEFVSYQNFCLVSMPPLWLHCEGLQNWETSTASGLKIWSFDFNNFRIREKIW